MENIRNDWISANLRIYRFFQVEIAMKLVCGDECGVLKVCDVARGTAKALTDAGNLSRCSKIAALCVAEEADAFHCARVNNELETWQAGELGSFQRVAVRQGLAGPATAGLCSLAGGRLLSASADGSVQVTSCDSSTAGDLGAFEAGGTNVHRVSEMNVFSSIWRKIHRISLH